MHRQFGDLPDASQTGNAMRGRQWSSLNFVWNSPGALRITVDKRIRIIYRSFTELSFR